MHSQDLSADWQFRRADQTRLQPATVPGCVHTDLLALGLIPDPFLRDNELPVLDVAEHDWVYRLQFTPIVREGAVFRLTEGRIELNPGSKLADALTEANIFGI